MWFIMLSERGNRAGRREQARRNLYNLRDFVGTLNSYKQESKNIGVKNWKKSKGKTYKKSNYKNTYKNY